MDTKMEDVGKLPEASLLSPASEPASIPTLDGWIESLMTCKQLAEVDVQRLCEKVRGGTSVKCIAAVLNNGMTLRLYQGTDRSPT
jgi:hypothetical protein